MPPLPTLRHTLPYKRMNPTSQPSGSHSARRFPTTQWTQVIALVQNKEDPAAAERALAEFCGQYRSAIYSFFRRKGCGHEEAEDHTQAFFESRIIERWQSRDGFLHAAQRSENRQFRSFLCHVLWRYLQDEWTKALTQRAGGGVAHVSLDETPLSSVLADNTSFDLFGREFDLAFVEGILRKTAEQSTRSRYLLAHFKGEMTQQMAAEALGLTSNAFKQDYARFRERFARELHKQVVKYAGPNIQEIESEIRYLLSLFGDSAT